jgi:succinate-semialdehyde dehydrogenase/glutarate-semialdehyde dehydrogenase
VNKKNVDKLISINPATLEPVGEVPLTLPQSVREIVHSTKDAFPFWRDLGVRVRSDILKRAQQNLLADAEEIAKLITLEMGRPLTESFVIEIHASVDVMGYYVKRAHKFLDDRRIPLHHLMFMRRGSFVSFEPLGVLGIITPWNWPLLIPLGSIFPALLSGNGVVFKPSEFTPLVAEKIKEIFLNAGVPEHVFQIIHGTADVGKALVDADIEKIFFTGSTEVGRQILMQASHTLKKCVLEMGGSDPAIVREDADLENTSSGLVWGAFCNCGQNCNGVERIYVHENVADSLIEKIIHKIKKIRIGDGLKTETDMGPLATEGQYIKMDAMVEMAKEMGGELLTGGSRINIGKGYFYQPTLFRWEKSIPQPKNVEIFGPLVLVTPVSSDEEAIDLANRSLFGLASSIWTRDLKKGKFLARRIEAGTVMVNDCIVSFGMSEAGWTGIKNSGIGWVHGEKGLDEMVNIKYVNLDPQFRSQKFWWFPYSLSMIKTMKSAITLLFLRKILKRFLAIPRVLLRMSGFLLRNYHRKDKL